MKVLVIDDEFGARETIKGMFAGLKVDATYAADAISALLYLKDHGDIEVVVTDYRLPGLGGTDWIELLRHYHPTVEVVIITGYEVAIDKLGGEKLKILKKPFEKHQLLEAIRYNPV